MNEDYAIIELIGNGSYSNVYAVERKHDNQKFALKQVGGLPSNPIVFKMRWL